MNKYDILILDYANFSSSTIPIALLAIKLNKSTREIKYLRRTEPWKFENYLNQFKKEIDSIKSIEYPPLPQGWYKKFCENGGLKMTNGQSLPTLEELYKPNNIF